MDLQNISDSQSYRDNNYTCISLDTLELSIPSEESSVIREHQADNLIERNTNDILKLRKHPFFISLSK